MPYKLLPFATIADSYRFLIARFADWFQLAIVPLIIWVAVDRAISNDWLAGWNLRLGSDSQLTAYWLINAPSFIAYLLVTVSLLSYAVALHRLALELPNSAGAFVCVSWRARHTRYAGQAVIVAAIILIGIIVSGTFVPMVGAVAVSAGVLGTAAGQVTLTVIVVLLFAVPIALLTCMVLTALPAAAAEDYAVTLSEASNQANGNLWRMTIVFLLGGLVPFWLIERGIAFLAMRASNDAGWIFATEVAEIVINFLAFTVLITLLSLIYRRLRENTILRIDQPPR